MTVPRALRPSGLSLSARVDVAVPPRRRVDGSLCSLIILYYHSHSYTDHAQYTTASPCKLQVRRSPWRRSPNCKRRALRTVLSCRSRHPRVLVRAACSTARAVELECAHLGHAKSMELLWSIQEQRSGRADARHHARSRGCTCPALSCVVTIRVGRLRAKLKAACHRINHARTYSPAGLSVCAL